MSTWPNGALRPDHYVGAVRAVWGGGAAVLDAPVEIDIRWPAWIPLLVVALGVLGGRYQAYMAGVGAALGDAYDRLLQLGARVDRMDPPSRDAMTQALGRVTVLLNARKAKEAADTLGRLEQCVDALERLEVLVGLAGQLTPEQQRQADEAVARARLGDGPECTGLVDALTTALLPPPAPLGGGGGGPRAGVFSGGLSATVLATVHTRFVAWLVLVLLISLSGLFTLYVTNGVRMGASPLADFVTLLAWGFTSDIASRTLANFRGS